jgi:hypothetical protein
MRIKIVLVALLILSNVGWFLAYWATERSMGQSLASREASAHQAEQDRDSCQQARQQLFQSNNRLIQDLDTCNLRCPHD